jgi:hypothetical protein
VDNRVGDVDTSTGADIESIGIVASLAVAINIINSNSVQSKTVGSIDAEDLNRGVLDCDVLDLGVDHLVGIEELGLGLAAVCSLSIPPASTISIEDGTRGSLDSDVSSRDGNQGAGPFLVAEGGLSFEDDLENRLVGSFYVLIE